ncbi:immune-associated nucleotide-binding protein 9 [Tanacetum coccineum]
MNSTITALSIQTTQVVNHGTGRQANQFGRLAKVEFPKFHGDDVRGWVFMCKQFFLIDNTQPKEKVWIISVHLSDKALLWHRQCIKTMGENVGWDVYKEAIIQRFSLVFKDLMVKLKNAKYDKSAKEHQDLFDTLLCRVDVSEDHALSLYLGGLPTELEMSVRIDSDSSNKPPLLPLPSANSISNPNPTTILKSPVRKHLTQKECKEKRAKNLCFYCNKKFVHGHKYEGQVFALVVLHMKELEVEFEDAQEELDELENEELPQISLNAFKGASSFQTMRVVGIIANKYKLLILVNSGSTHNFLDINVAKRMGCNIIPTSPVSITMAGGKQLVSMSEFKGFT